MTSACLPWEIDPERWHASIDNNPHGAAMHGVTGLAKTLANELAQHLSGVKAVHPHGVATGLTVPELHVKMEGDETLGPLEDLVEVTERIGDVLEEDVVEPDPEGSDRTGHAEPGASAGGRECLAMTCREGFGDLVRALDELREGVGGRG